MPNTSQCFTLIRGKAMRITRLDACGAPVLGPASAVVSKGFVSVALAATTEAGTTISVTNANGDVCVRDEPAPIFLGYTVTIELCGVNPDMINLLTGQAIVFDSQATPQGVGFRMNSDVDLGATGFALEVWSAVPDQACVTGNKSYGYFLLPFLKGGIIGDFTIGNDAINFTISGAQTKKSSGWGVGPYNITRNTAGVAVPLKTAILSGDHLHLELVTVAPPVEVCGSVALGTPATGATAGTPGTYTPANSYGPATFATIGALTASPNTNWTTGQYIVLRDGTFANWTGTVWAAGIHA